MVKSGHCLQQMQRKEGQQNSQAAGVETEKESIGEQASARNLFRSSQCRWLFADHLSLHKVMAVHCTGTISVAGGSVGGHGARC